MEKENEMQVEYSGETMATHSRSTIKLVSFFFLIDVYKDENLYLVDQVIDNVLSELKETQLEKTLNIDIKVVLMSFAENVVWNVQPTSVSDYNYVKIPLQKI